MSLLHSIHMQTFAQLGFNVKYTTHHQCKISCNKNITRLPFPDNLYLWIKTLLSFAVTAQSLVAELAPKYLEPWDHSRWSMIMIPKNEANAPASILCSPSCQCQWPSPESWLPQTDTHREAPAKMFWHKAVDDRIKTTERRNWCERLSLFSQITKTL